MNPKLICFSCMRELPEEGAVCPFCGHDNRLRGNGPGFLKSSVLGGQYLTGKVLGRGGFGITYLGLDLILKRKVAIKEYYPEGVVQRDQETLRVVPFGGSMDQAFQEGLSRAVREARTAAQMEDIPNTVRIYSVLEANGTVYIVMEYIDGITLTSLVQQSGGKLPWVQAWPMIDPILDTLSRVHSRGIVHRDVSPDNIMIRFSDSSPVLLDFGTARDFTTGNTEHSTSLRLGFSPMEMYTSSGAIDQRSDEYAAMATLYYMLTGKKPESPLNVAAGIGKIERPSELGSDIPTGAGNAEEVLMRGLACRMDQRYPTIEALRQAFRRALEQGATMVAPPEEAEQAEGKSKIRPEDRNRGKEESGNLQHETPDKPGKQPPANSNDQKKTGNKTGSGKKNRLIIISAISIAAIMVTAACIVIFGNKREETGSTIQPEPTSVETVQGDSPQQDIEKKDGARNDTVMPTPTPTATPTPKPEQVSDQDAAEKLFKLGENYEYGNGVEQSYEKAAEYYKKAADQGYAEAQYNLGVLYGNGDGVKQSYEKAAEYYKKAADQGEAKAQYNLGVLYYNGDGVKQSYEKASEYFTKAADQGEAKAQYNLGVLYENGDGVKQSYEKASEYFTKAADQGLAEAQYNLGVLYYNGDGVKQSYEKAAEYYKKAADQGLAKAQFDLGVCYGNGDGVKQSYEKAAEYYKKAADQGHTKAQCYLGELYYNGNGVKQSYEKAAEYFKKAADQGEAKAQYNLGICYTYGNGVKQSYEKASECFKKAADQGLAKAQYSLGMLYYNGNGVKQSHEKAAEYYKKAADQGLAKAQFNLGVCYTFGNGVKQSYVKAAEYYKKAADQGNADAQYNLGLLFEYGYGVEQSYEKAAEYYRKATEQGNETAPNKLKLLNEKGYK